jgi:hypothetical protein
LEFKDKLKQYINSFFDGKNTGLQELEQLIPYFHFFNIDVRILGKEKDSFINFIKTTVSFIQNEVKGKEIKCVIMNDIIYNEIQNSLFKMNINIDNMMLECWKFLTEIFLELIQFN